MPGQGRYIFCLEEKGGAEVSGAVAYWAGAAGSHEKAGIFRRTENKARGNCLGFFPCSPETGLEGEGTVMPWSGSAVSSAGFLCRSLTLLVLALGRLH